ncbi:50S ribosomal protein L18P [mine drainage metagenome]|uniref:50S ribosomal protein L18 n=1 Tax=mine drainage metagenome TaxID=410659 RepID=T1B0J4_9ZZZZ
MKVIRKRRAQGVTDYKKRLTLLKGGLPRVVIRRSNRGIRMQIAEYEVNGDKILATANSNELSKFGWMPKRNTPTAYLTGVLLAKKAKGIESKEFVLDIGLYRPSKASILFAAAKGAMDSGMGIRGNIEFDEKRIFGHHISDYSKKLGNESVEFSTYRKKGLDVGSMEALVNKVKEAITK